MNHADVVVVGLGAAGAATTWQLARKGVRVVGIDKYSPPHAFGSSYGDTRITRQAIGEGTAYVPLVLRSHELWRELEQLTGTEILNQCGMLLLTSDASEVGNHGIADFFASTVDTAIEHGIEHEIMTPAESRARFPQFAIDDAYRCYFEPGGGFVRPEAAVAAQLSEAERDGAILRRNETVVSIEQDTNGVRVVTDMDTYSADRVVICGGPWIKEFLRDADPSIASVFSVHRQTLNWFETTGDFNQLTPEKMPTFIWEFGPLSDDQIYGFPAVDGQGGGLKIATEQHSEITTPDTMQRDVSATEARDVYDECVKGRLPALLPNAVKSTACLYTTTPDAQFVIDWLPEKDRVMLVSPCSGHGFKHSAALGESVSQWIADGASSIDMSSFSFSRFS